MTSLIASPVINSNTLRNAANAAGEKINFNVRHLTPQANFRLIAGRFINPATGKLKKGTIRVNRRANPFRGICGFDPKISESHCEVFSGERPKFPTPPAKTK